MSRLREYLAEKLAPEMENKALRYDWLMGQLHDGYRWMGEFREITAFLEWLIQSERDSWRGIAEKPWMKWKWYGGISEFREHLRREGIPDHVNEELRSSLQRLVKANDAVQNALAGIGDAADNLALRNAQAEQDHAEREAKRALGLVKAEALPPVDPSTPRVAS